MRMRMEGDGFVRGCSASLVHGGSVRHGFSSVEGDHVSFELDPLVCGRSDWLKSIPSAEKHVLIETTRATEMEQIAERIRKFTSG